MVFSGPREREVYAYKYNVRLDPLDFVDFDVTKTDESYIADNFRHTTIKSIKVDETKLEYGLDWGSEYAVREDIISSSTKYRDMLEAVGVIKLRTILQ